MVVKRVALMYLYRPYRRLLISSTLLMMLVGMVVHIFSQLLLFSHSTVGYLFSLI